MTLYHFLVYPEAGAATYWAKEVPTEVAVRLWLLEHHPDFSQGHRIMVEVDPPRQNLC